MRTLRNRKWLALIISISLILQLLGGIPEGIGGISRRVKAAEIPDESVALPLTTEAHLTAADSSITYYIGGAGASDSNSGIESTSPYATLAKAVQELNKQPGNYKIIALGDTNEPEASVIGDGINEFNVTITTVTGSAIIMRNKEVPGDLITVSGKSSLTLGENDDTYSSELTIDGGRTHYHSGVDYGNIIKVNVGGSFTVHNRVIIQNIYRHTPNYEAYGGAIYNSGSFYMYGGTVQLCYADYGAGVYNAGTFKLYGGKIQNNGYAYIGSGVYNKIDALFEMYGGSITANNGSSYAGGVGNAGSFYLSGGSIDNNYANSNGGVYNESTGVMYISGSGAISQNRSDYSNAGIINQGSIYMSGGSINNNICSDAGGGISNFNYFEMTGGAIEDNTADMGGAVYNDSDATFIMKGGTLRNNIAAQGGAVYNEGDLYLQGDIQIPAGTNSKNSIHLLSPLTITGAITSTENIALSLDSYRNSVGEQWIKEGEPGLFASQKEKIVLLNINYSFSSNGVLEYNGLPTTYYVGGANSSDSNSGTQEEPFATLMHALEFSNDSVSTIILQSDQEISETVTIKGDITIKSDGSRRTVTKSSTFSDTFMFEVDGGSLSLGDQGNSDPSDILIFDGQSRAERYGFLDNDKSIVNIYQGVSIKNFNSYYACITNAGTLNLMGGSIVYNSSEDEGIIQNLKDFNMIGGSIGYNSGSGVYNENIGSIRRFAAAGPGPIPVSQKPVIHMTGGSIFANTANEGSGIYNEGILILSGSASLPEKDGIHNDIYLAKTDVQITIDGELSTSEQFLVSRPNYIEGAQVLNGQASLIKSNHNKFKLAASDHIINEKGIIRYTKAASVYYVNASGSDYASGGINDPFATLKKAVQEIGTGVGTIYLQSDITIYETIEIVGTVTLLSYGGERTINRGDPFITEYRDYGASGMFYVLGGLVLGNQSGNDLRPNLFLNGKGEVRQSRLGPIITNEGKLELYPGVVILNCFTDSYSGILSVGTFHMYGGCIRDNEGDLSGVFIESGNFIMDGGTISNNYGEFSGVILGLDTKFIMNGGSIVENTTDLNSPSRVAGIVANGSSITLNGGSISRNEGGIGGIYAYQSQLNINATGINDNSGMIAGIGALYLSNIRMSGGSIINNRGIMSGIVLDIGSELDLSGGRIGGRTEEALYSGILVSDSSTLILSGNAVVEADSRITLMESPLKNTIKVKGPLTSTGTTAIIDVGTVEESTGEFTPVYTIGRSLLEVIEGHALSLEDVSKLKLGDDSYSINLSGKIGKDIKESWLINPRYQTSTYSGRNIFIGIELKDGSKVLTKDVDYIVRYNNNIDSGRGMAVIIGIGDYAGSITQDFTIYKAVATRILTSVPADLHFSAAEHLTAEQLLQKITLNSVEVEFENGRAWLPVVWKLTGGVYSPMGGTYIYTGIVQGDRNISANGLTLTARIIVDPIEPFRSESLSLGSDKGEDVSVIYRRDGKDVYVEFRIDENAFLDREDKATLPISTKELLRQLKSEETDRITISITLPASAIDGANQELLSILLSEEFMKEAREAGKDITISIKDENGVERYSWTFSGNNLSTSLFENSDVELTLKVSEATEVEELKELLDKGASNGDDTYGLVIQFEHEGELPAQASVRIYVGDREGVKAGSKIYLYHYNPKTNKLETLPGGSGYVVDEEGYITVNILHCSEYVALNAEAGKKQISSLRNQISVKVEKKVIYTGGKNKPKSTKIIITLPTTLELVDSLENASSQTAIGGVTVTYQSTDESVAVINSKGEIRAVGEGKTTIITTLTLYSGKVKTVKTVVTVKKK